VILDVNSLDLKPFIMPAQLHAALCKQLERHPAASVNALLAILDEAAGPRQFLSMDQALALTRSLESCDEAIKVSFLHVLAIRVVNFWKIPVSGAWCYYACESRGRFFHLTPICATDMTSLVVSRMRIRLSPGGCTRISLTAAQLKVLARRWEQLLETLGLGAMPRPTKAVWDAFWRHKL